MSVKAAVKYYLENKNNQIQCTNITDHKYKAMLYHGHPKLTKKEVPLMKNSEDTLKK